MAKAIGPTPEVTGKDALRILRAMNEPPSKKDKEIAKKLKLKDSFHFKKNIDLDLILIKIF